MRESNQIVIWTVVSVVVGMLVRDRKNYSQLTSVMFDKRFIAPILEGRNPQTQKEVAYQRKFHGHTHVELQQRRNLRESRDTNPHTQNNDVTGEILGLTSCG